MSLIMKEEVKEEEEEPKGFYAGFIIYCDDVDTYRRLNVMLDRLFGAKLITSKVNVGKLYLTKIKPPDFNEDIEIVDRRRARR
jgi:hypothetical protein